VAGDLPQSDGRWGVGADLAWETVATLGVAVLGRHPFSGPDVSLLLPRTQGPPEPLFGLDDEHPDFFDSVISVRAGLWRDRLIGVAGVVLPLNRDGVRADAVPIVGLEAVF